MKRLVIGFVAACLAAVVAAGGQAQANLLVDGTFNLATNGTETSNSPWTLTVNKPDGTNRAAQFQTGFANAENTGVGGPQAPGTGAGVWFRSFEGNQDPNDPLAQATLTQSIIAPKDGDYILFFRAGIEDNFTAGTWDVSFSSSGTGGTDTVDLLANPPSPFGNLGGAASANPRGDRYDLFLNGVTAGDTLTVTGRMIDGVDFGTNPQSAYLDQFTLQVPEPTTLLLAGFGAAGLLVRRRR